MTRTWRLIVFLFFACGLLLAVGVYSDAQRGMFYRAALLGGCLVALPVVAFLQRHKPPYAKKHRDLKQIPTTNWAAVIERYATDWIGVVLGVTFLASFFFWFPFGEFLYVSAAYGHDAWVSGLHIVNKQGELSNGDKANSLVYFAAFASAIATWLASICAAAYLAMGFHRERLSDQLELYERSLRSLPP